MHAVHVVFALRPRPGEKRERIELVDLISVVVLAHSELA